MIQNNSSLILLAIEINHPQSFLILSALIEGLKSNRNIHILEIFNKRDNYKIHRLNIIPLIDFLKTNKTIVSFVLNRYRMYGSVFYQVDSDYNIILENYEALAEMLKTNKTLCYLTTTSIEDSNNSERVKNAKNIIKYQLEQNVLNLNCDIKLFKTMGETKNFSHNPAFNISFLRIKEAQIATCNYLHNLQFPNLSRALSYAHFYHSTNFFKLHGIFQNFSETIFNYLPQDALVIITNIARFKVIPHKKVDDISTKSNEANAFQIT